MILKVKYYWSFVVVAILGLLVWGCGGGGGGGGSSVTVNVTPDTASIGQSESILFTVSVGNATDTSVTWSASAGTITPQSPTTAMYTAPAANGTYTVTATSNADPSRSDTSTVTVSALGVTITPDNPSAGTCTNIDFTANVVGSVNKNVTWSASAGAIVSTGPNTATFTAPDTEGPVTVTATSVVDGTTSDSTIVTVAKGNVTLTGAVIRDDTNARVGGVVVIFLNSSNQEVARVTSSASQNFNVSVPLSAVRFHVLTSSLDPSQFYRAYKYNNLIYTTLDPNCTGPLPPLGNCTGTVVNMPNSIRLFPTSGPPPPPPTGCGGP